MYIRYPRQSSDTSKLPVSEFICHGIEFIYILPIDTTLKSLRGLMIIRLYHMDESDIICRVLASGYIIS
jgi:hypothetical protein